MKKLLILLVIVALAACKTQVSDKESCKSDLIKKEAFEKEIDGKKTSLFLLENANGIKVYITNYGARVVSLITPDKEGECADIVLGFDNIDSYLEDKMYLGCIVGRYANRIKGGKFTIDGREYNLFLNDARIPFMEVPGVLIKGYGRPGRRVIHSPCHIFHPTVKKVIRVICRLRKYIPLPMKMN